MSREVAVDRRRAAPGGAPDRRRPTRSRATTRSCAATCWGACSTSWASTCATGRPTSPSSRSARATRQADGEPREWWRLAFALAGAAEPAAWNRATRPYDLDDAKGVIELLAAQARARRRPTYAAGPRRAAASTPGAPAARQHPRLGSRRSSASSTRAIVDAWELRTTGRVVVAELAIDGPRGGPPAPERAPAVGRYPGGRPRPRDRRPRGHARGRGRRTSIRAHAGALLRDVDLFDIYRGIPLAPDEKSLAFRLRLGAPDRTLTEPDVDGAVAAVVAALSSIGGRIRT